MIYLVTKFAEVIGAMVLINLIIKKFLHLSPDGQKVSKTIGIFSTTPPSSVTNRNKQTLNSLTFNGKSISTQ